MIQTRQASEHENPKIILGFRQQIHLLLFQLFLLLPIMAQKWLKNDFCSTRTVSSDHACSKQLSFSLSLFCHPPKRDGLCVRTGCCCQKGCLVPCLICVLPKLQLSKRQLILVHINVFRSPGAQSQLSFFSW